MIHILHLSACYFCVGNIMLELFVLDSVLNHGAGPPEGYHSHAPQQQGQQSPFV